VICRSRSFIASNSSAISEPLPKISAGAFTPRGHGLHMNLFTA
jgi:hypothetical protein